MGAEMLNYRVRDGNGWVHLAITTKGQSSNLKDDLLQILQNDRALIMQGHSSAVNGLQPQIKKPSYVVLTYNCCVDL